MQIVVVFRELLAPLSLFVGVLLEVDEHRLQVGQMLHDHRKNSNRGVHSDDPVMIELRRVVPRLGDVPIIQGRVQAIEVDDNEDCGKSSAPLIIVFCNMC